MHNWTGNEACLHDYTKLTITTIFIAAIVITIRIFTQFGVSIIFSIQYSIFRIDLICKSKKKTKLKVDQLELFWKNLNDVDMKFDRKEQLAQMQYYILNQSRNLVRLLMVKEKYIFRLKSKAALNNFAMKDYYV